MDHDTAPVPVTAALGVLGWDQLDPILLAALTLEAPVLRVTGYDMPYPPSRVEEEFLPDLDRVLDAVDRAMAF